MRKCDLRILNSASLHLKQTIITMQKVDASKLSEDEHGGWSFFSDGFEDLYFLLNKWRGEIAEEIENKKKKINK